MRIKITFVLAFIFTLPALANGDIATTAKPSVKKSHAVSPSPSNAVQAKKRIVTKRLVTARPTQPPVYAVMLYPGSLKANIIRISHNYGWNTVVWSAPEDYAWIGTARITANSLPAIMNKILIGYPLQAQFYQGNRVLAIAPRNLP